MQRLGSLLAAVFVGVCLGAEPEPTYEGKTLGQWSAQAKDQDPQLREQAARALGKMGADAKAAIPILTGLLRDPVVGVRLAAAEALGKMGPQTQSAAISCLLDVVQSKTKEAAANLDLARRRLYVSDMRLAQRAWEDLQPGRLLELLDGQRPEQTGGTDYRGFEWYYWQRVQNSQLRLFEGHTDQVTCLAFSPDGSRVASGSEDKTVKLWEAATGKELRTLTGHTGPITCLAFSHDGTRLVATCKGVVKVWDLPGGRETLSLQPGDWGTIAGIVFSPNGKLLAAADGQNDVWPGFLRLWDAATGRALETVEIDDEGLASVVFSPDGQRLAWGSWNRLSVRDLASHREVLSFHVGQDPSGPVFSRDGRRIAAGSRYFSGTCMVWDAVTGEEIDKLKSDAEWIQVLAFSPDGRRIATHSGMIGGAGELKIREVLRHQEVFSLRLPGGMGTSVAVSPDLRQVAAAWGRTVRIWDATGDPEVVVCGGRGSINGVAFTEDDRRLVGAGGDDAVRVWDTASGQELRMFGQATEGSTMDTRVESVALGPRGEWLAAARGSDVVLWDLRSGDTLFTLKGRVSRSGSD